MAQGQTTAHGKTFFMLGLIHRDEKGSELLDKWINRIGPEVITLEFSGYGLQFRQKRGKEYRERLHEIAKRLEATRGQADSGSLEELRAYIDMPFELETASLYSTGHDVPFYLVDMDLFSYLKLRKIDELVSAGNLEKLTEEQSTGSPGKVEETAARLYFDKGVNIVPYTEEMYIRDRYMSNRIAILMKYYRGRKFLHICGWQHLSDPHGMYSRFDPIKVFIYDKAIRV